jgi:hypothetical protein
VLRLYARIQSCQNGGKMGGLIGPTDSMPSDRKAAKIYNAPFNIRLRSAGWFAFAIFATIDHGRSVVRRASV